MIQLDVCACVFFWFSVNLITCRKNMYSHLQVRRVGLPDRMRPPGGGRYTPVHIPQPLLLLIVWRCLLSQTWENQREKITSVCISFCGKTSWWKRNLRDTWRYVGAVNQHDRTAQVMFCFWGSILTQPHTMCEHNWRDYFALMFSSLQLCSLPSYPDINNQDSKNNSFKLNLEFVYLLRQSQRFFFFHDQSPEA